MRSADLQEAGDVPLVVDAHGHHVLEHPEERTVFSFFGLGLAQQAVELKKQPSCSSWSKPDSHQGLVTTLRVFGIKKKH